MFDFGYSRIGPGQYSTAGMPLFLAGPIGGGGAWRDEAVNEICSLHRAASPITFIDPSLAPSMLLSDDERVTWEHRMFDHSVAQGVVLMWLGEQREATRTKYGYPKPYGSMSLMELGWMTYHLAAFSPGGSPPIALGISPYFPSHEYLIASIRSRAPQLHINGGLKETTNSALKLLLTRGNSA